MYDVVSISRDEARSGWDDYHLPGTFALYQSGHWLERYMPADCEIAEVVEGGRSLARFVFSHLSKPHSVLHDPFEVLLASQPSWWSSNDVSGTNRTPENNPFTAAVPLSQTPKVDSGSFFPAMVCSTLAERDNTLMLRRELADEQAATVVATILDFLEEQAKKRGARSIIFPNFPLNDAKLLTASTHGYVAVYGFGRHLLKLAGSFDEHLEKLRGRDRKDVRRHIKKFEKASFRHREILWPREREQVVSLLEVHAKKYSLGSEHISEVLSEFDDPKLKTLLLGTEAPDGALIGVLQLLFQDDVCAGRNVSFHDRAPGRQRLLREQLLRVNKSSTRQRLHDPRPVVRHKSAQSRGRRDHEPAIHVRTRA